MSQNNTQDAHQFIRYFEASAAELIRNESSNKPGSNTSFGLGFDAVSFLEQETICFLDQCGSTEFLQIIQHRDPKEPARN